MLIRIILLSILLYTDAFLHNFNNINKPIKIKNSKQDSASSCNERIIYKNYLIGLRKLRKNFKIANTESLIQFINFTNNYISNTPIISNNTIINNEILGAKTITMSNIQIDVSNIKHIKISTKKESLIVELDKKNTFANIVTEINNIDSMINALSLLLHIIKLT
jgi:CxxC motif-containing protein